MKAFFRALALIFIAPFECQIEKFKYGDNEDKFEVIMFFVCYPFRWVWNFLSLVVRSMVFVTVVYLTLAVIFYPAAVAELFGALKSLDPRQIVDCLRVWIYLNVAAVGTCAALGFIRVGPYAAPRFRPASAITSSVK